MKNPPGYRRQFSRLPILCAGALALLLPALHLRAREDKTVPTADAHYRWGQSLVSRSDYANAEVEFRKAFADWKGSLGREHPKTLECSIQLASVLIARSKFAEAEERLRDVLAICMDSLGEKHPNTLECFYRLAIVFQKQNKIDEAREFARMACDGASRTLGEKDPKVKVYEKLWLELKSAKESKEKK